ncbi:MAG: DUF4124 domain-containing protein [Pseudomonadota bacterium]
MIRKSCFVLLFTLFAGAAQADVWKWVDAKGNTHFVDTTKPIYTWVDESGKVHYSDTPDHRDAVSVQLVWVSGGSLNEVAADETSKSERTIPGETDEQRAEREAAEAYFCKRATEVYDSYVNAPQLYTTGANGEREYLSDEEAAATIADTAAKKEKFCN